MLLMANYGKPPADYGGDRLLTAEEAAAILRISTKTLYRLRDAGKLNAVKIGRSLRYRESDLKRYMKGL